MLNHYSRKSLFLITFLLAMVLTLGTISSKGEFSPLSSAAINVSPKSGPPGTKATVTGSGFPQSISGKILWNSQSGQELGSFTTSGNGGFSTSIKFPLNATPGQYGVWACFFPQQGSPLCASSIVNVTTPATVPPPTDTPTECDVLDIPGEVLIDFEDLALDQNLRGETLPEGVRFVGDSNMFVFSPLVPTKSESKALQMDYAGEFGSISTLMRIRFANLQDFVGMYVGLNERIWVSSPITAVLTAYARDESGLLIVVGSDSVSFGPDATPIRECLSVAASEIEEVTLTYGTAAEPEVIDDLIFRGPEIPVPALGDDNPPEITILIPEADALYSSLYVHLQGEVREDRELASMDFQLNSGSSHDLAFTPAGITPEGEHLYLFALDPLPVSDLELCGDNILEIRAIDNSDNVGNENQTFRTRIGDLSVTEAEPVQVVYGADLVQKKGTAFRVKVQSTYTCLVDAEFLLDLSDEQWSTWPVGSGGLIIGLPPGTEYPDAWGPVPIPAGATDHTVMLPYIPPGQEDLLRGSSAPAGLVRHPDGLNPDVRVLPRPIAYWVRFSVEIDPENQVVEENETNNRFDSPPYRAVPTRPYTFVAYQTRVIGPGGECTPNMTDVEAAFGSAVEYVLGVFPIADAKIRALTGAGLQTWDTNTTERWEFLGEIDTLAKSFGGDFGVAMTCHGGGTSGGDSAFVGVAAPVETLAHEYNHVVVPMGDIYSLDCYCHWGESYCELPDGTRFYCCYDESYDGGQDWISERAREVAMGVDPGLGCTVDCGQNESVACEGCCWDTCGTECTAVGGTRYWCPDGRPGAEGMLPASDGFWANRWLPEEGKTYFMDGPAGDNWMILESTVASGYSTCWDVDGVGINGYGNLLNNPRFRSIVDPAALLVNGSITRDGQVNLLPFIILPEAILDREPGTAGAYSFVLKDRSGNLLSQTGFDLRFWQSDPNGGLMDEAHFALRIEWVEGTEIIELLDQTGTLLASREVTRGVPTVEITAPAGSERTLRSVEIRWQASDPDGDELTYSLAVSADEGVTWQPIAGHLEIESYSLPVSMLKMDTDYLVKILATDGVNTGSAVSDEPFRVEIGLPKKSLYVVVACLIALAAGSTALIITKSRRKRG